MLLMRADKDGKPVPEDHYNEEWPVNTIWRLRADDPLVPGFEEAARYLSEKDPERRREVFRDLCRSRLKNIRSVRLLRRIRRPRPRPAARPRPAGISRQ